MAQRHATQSQAPPGQDAAAPSSKAFRKHTPCSPRELVAFQTYPLQTTWPLVITSLIMYCASWYAWHSRAKNDGDWMLTVMASMQSLSATFSWIHWLDARAGWRAALDKIWARSAFVAYNLSALARMRGLKLNLMGWPLFPAIIVCYKYSRKYRKLDSGTRKARWVIYHAAFHLLVITGQIWVIYAVSEIH